MSKNFGHNMKLQKGDLKTQVKGNLTAVMWKDKQNVNILMNMHSSPSEGNFCVEHGKAVKLATAHMGYVDKSDRMTNSYCISRRTWKWTKKLFFNLLGLTILNSFIIFTSGGSKLSH
jgi:hypothetical protein